MWRLPLPLLRPSSARTSQETSQPFCRSGNSERWVKRETKNLLLPSLKGDQRRLWWGKQFTEPNWAHFTSIYKYYQMEGGTSLSRPPHKKELAECTKKKQVNYHTSLYCTFKSFEFWTPAFQRKTHINLVPKNLEEKNLFPSAYTKVLICTLQWWIGKKTFSDFFPPKEATNSHQTINIQITVEVVSIGLGDLDLTNIRCDPCPQGVSGVVVRDKYTWKVELHHRYSFLSI